jgi:hypothetical protein
LEISNISATPSKPEDILHLLQLNKSPELSKFHPFIPDAIFCLEYAATSTTSNDILVPIEACHMTITLFGPPTTRCTKNSQTSAPVQK